jgi:hypothetical protein
MPIKLPILLAVLSFATSLQAQNAKPPVDTFYVADRFFADKTTTGAVIVAKFQTAKQRADLLRFETTVDSAADRVWRFDDILISLDLDGNGWVAIWRVAGPKPVVEKHLARVRELARGRSVIYDYEIRPAVVRCACD